VRATSLFSPFLLVLLLSCSSKGAPLPEFKRVVILKVDGLNEDLLQRSMQQQDPNTGRSRLPWFTHVFAENGIIFRNFYVRGISLSAPSWSMLDTGRHSIIRGNVEYDRYTGEVYDYLNFFPFYLGYARNRAVDMPGVEVLDRAGIPLLIDQFPYDQVLRSFQLFQRGVRWTTLKDALLRSFSSRSLFSILESAAPISLSSSLSRELETLLERGLRGPNLLYLDFFTGEIDHEGHATSDPAALLHVLQELDALVGRVWTAMQQGPLSRQTLLVVVSDHGMNNVPGILSQTFSLPDLFNSEEGGAHHVVTDREQLSDYKLKGINPLVHRVITPSTRSFYLEGQATRYPTVWLDIDGNERAAVHLRNNDLNRIHILLQQLTGQNLPAGIREAAVERICQIIDLHRARWTKTVSELNEELEALDHVIAEHKKLLAEAAYKTGAGSEDKAKRRLRHELREWQREESGYKAYLAHLQALLRFKPDETRPFTAGYISTLMPEMSLGDNNTVADIQHYVVGPSPAGLAIDKQGHLDDQQSFRFVNYFSVLANQRTRNNPQHQLSSKPIDFIATALPDAEYSHALQAPERAYWLFGDAEHQIIILQDAAGRLRLQPVGDLNQQANGEVTWRKQVWRAGLPLRLYEDPKMRLPSGQNKGEWLSTWHTEREWFSAVHECEYSNGIIGIAEELSSIAAHVPGPAGISPVLHRYEQRRRELVQADFHIFAADHWNFNVRFPNPGGNHGSFLRISTHSVWMMAGDGLPVRNIEEPYDSLNFASTILSLLGRTPPMPDRVVSFIR
jgi:type I phosphodiesterase/nucleotide pyrophosphatase